jgi:hypothetical protein
VAHGRVVLVVVCDFSRVTRKFLVGSPEYWMQVIILLFLNTAINGPRVVAKSVQTVVKGQLVGSGWRRWKEVESGSLERFSTYSPAVSFTALSCNGFMAPCQHK